MDPRFRGDDNRGEDNKVSSCHRSIDNILKDTELLEIKKLVLRLIVLWKLVGC
jgi:hypothetical protein